MERDSSVELTEPDVTEAADLDPVLPPDRDVAEADALEQLEPTDLSDLDDEVAIGVKDANEADALEQARPVPFDEDER